MRFRRWGYGVGFREKGRGANACDAGLDLLVWIDFLSCESMSGTSVVTVLFFEKKSIGDDCAFLCGEDKLHRVKMKKHSVFRWIRYIR